MIAIGHVLQDMLGTSTLFSGLGCVPTSPAGMTVNVNPGRAYSLQSVDAGAYSSLAADTTHSIVKQGIILDVTNLSCPAPTTAGYSINYLVQGAFQEVDTTSVVLPYYNASNPAQAYNGPAGAGTSQMTQRDNTVQLSLKAGVAATTGSQITPTPDAGYNGLWVITVPYGALTITSANISQYSGAPFLASPLLTQIQSAPNGVVGQSRNLVMNVSAASATATLTADEIMVETALGGQIYKLASFSKSINLASTGAGGMDTGTAPVSGFVALYAIYNPTTQTAALLAANATSAAAPSVYGGANMPSGYAASGLVAIVPTNASSQFPICFVRDRKVNIVRAVAYTSTANHSSMTAVSLSAVVPKNAVRVWGDTFYSSSVTADSLLWSVGSDTSQAGTTFFRAGASNGQYPYVSDMPTTQTVYITNTGVTGTITFNVNVTAYDF